MMNEIPLDEFLEDIRRQKEERKIRELKPPKEPWEAHPEALRRSDYDYLTSYGRHQLKKPRPVWLPDKKRWTVGAPVNPIEWQILVQSETTRSRPPKRVIDIDAKPAIKRICGQFRLGRYTFPESVDRLCDKNLLKVKGGFRRSRIADKWLFPDLSGRRAGGEWHRKYILSYIDEVCRLFGCYTYADRGYWPGAEMPDVITVKPRLVERGTDYDFRREPLEWDMENPVYAEFKSAQDMRNNPSRLKKQLDRWEGVPLYLEVEAKVWETKDMLEERGRREVDFLDLIREAEGDMICFGGSERPRAERSFEPVLERIREAFRETYDRKARLKKVGTNPDGKERHDLILYDSLGTPKNVGQVIPNYADDVELFAELYFDKKRLGRVTTADYVYVPDRKPTPENKTWKWERRKTRGSRFRSFTL